MNAELEQRLLAALTGGQVADLISVLDQAAKANTLETALAVLASLHGKSLDLAVLLAAVPDDFVVKVLRLLLPVVARIERLRLDEAEALLQFANRVPASYLHGVITHLSVQLSRNAALAAELGSVLAAQGACGDQAGRVWAASFAGALPDQAAAYVAGSIESSPAANTQAIALITFLELQQPTVSSTLLSHEQAIAATFRDQARETPESWDAWMAICRFAEISAVAMGDVTQVLREGPTVGRRAVSSWLVRCTRPVVGATSTPLADLLDPLTASACIIDDLRRDVDSLLAALLYQGTTQSVAETALHSIGTADIDISEAFPNALGALSEHPDAFSRVLTTWLTTQDVALAAVRGLLSQCISGHGAAAIDATIFNAAADDGKARAIRRLLALTHNGPVVCHFVAVLAETPALQPHGLQMAEEMLNYLFVEYPGATEEFLAAKCKVADKKTGVGQVYRNVYANALRWKRVLNQLPKLNEVRPTDTQMFALRRLRARMNRDILRAAEERSIFAQLSTKMSIRQGRRFASHTPYGPPQVSDMKETGHSIELPSSERADPVGGMLRRALLLRSAR